MPRTAACVGPLARKVIRHRFIPPAHTKAQWQGGEIPTDPCPRVGLWAVLPLFKRASGRPVARARAPCRAASHWLIHHNTGRNHSGIGNSRVWEEPRHKQLGAHAAAHCAAASRRRSRREWMCRRTDGRECGRRTTRGASLPARHPLLPDRADHNCVPALPRRPGTQGPTERSKSPLRKRFRQRIGSVAHSSVVETWLFR
jgi:hypothetical protein